MKTQKSITSNNTTITALADIIQNSRMVLSSDNEQVDLHSEETRKIILICLLYLRANYSTLPIDSFSFERALISLNINNIGVFNLNSNDSVQSVELIGALNQLSNITQYSDWSNLINYALESLEYDVEDYFNTKKSRGTRNTNNKKKESGIYYTPLDVVDFIVSQCLDATLPLTDKPAVLDCSCGSGVFLIQSLRYIERIQNPDCDLDVSLHILEQCIWGIDISPAAVDCCKAVFLKYYLDHYEDATARLAEIWKIIDRSIFIGDATQIQEILSQNPVLPKCFDCIVGNPPYVTEGRESNLFIPFVDNMTAYSSDYSCSAMILPLSICYSQGSNFIRLRKKIQKDRATWTFMNYDRSPDSLFGDQVKTRNTILFRRSTESTTDIYTTKLQRWTSESRCNLFTKYTLCRISEMSISQYVPKISNSIEKVACERINSRSSNLYTLFTHDIRSYPLIVNGTAYNWLCVYDHIPPSFDENKNPYKSSTTRVYYLPDRESRDFCIAILSNRISYWYWNVIGDGFHFNASFLSDFTVGKDSFTESQYLELCRLGREYSEKIKRYPTVSYNAGKCIVNYSHWEVMDIVQNIEKIIIDAFCLTDDFASHIEQWYFNQVHCNRENEKR